VERDPKDSDRYLLAGLIAEAREDQRARAPETPWQKLLEGRLSAEDEAYLRAQAAHDPEVARALEAYAPLAARVQERMLAAITNDASGIARVRSITSASTPATAASTRASALSPRWFAIPLATAAGLLLWIATRKPIDDLPSYALAFETTAQDERSADAPSPKADVKLRATTQVDLILRPHDSPKTPVAMRAISMQNGVARPWAPPSEVSATGVVRIRGKASELFPTPHGEYELLIAVGRPEALPSDADLAEILQRQKPLSWPGAKLLSGKARFVEGP
jgi:hypothetical protein